MIRKLYFHFPEVRDPYIDRFGIRRCYVCFNTRLWYTRRKDWLSVGLQVLGFGIEYHSRSKNWEDDL